jgi:hypothetical protein
VQHLTVDGVVRHLLSREPIHTVSIVWAERFVAAGYSCVSAASHA